MYLGNSEFSKHSENLAAVKKGLTQLERAHKEAIRSGSAPQIETLRRLHFLTLGILAEATLRKIVVDPLGFNDRERQLVWRARSQLDRWLEAVELSARRHYKVLIHKPVDASSIGLEAFDRYDTVRSLLTGQLRPVIEDRNKIAHGQWKWRLRSGQENSFLETTPPSLPNYCSLSSQAQLITTIGNLVHIFAISEPTFERDYQKLMSKLAEAQSGLDGHDYARLVAQLKCRKNPNKDHPARGEH